MKITGKGVLSILLALVLLTGMAPAAVAGVSAAEPDETPETYEHDGVIYYNVHSENIGSPKRFYLDLLSGGSPDFGYFRPNAYFGFSRTPYYFYYYWLCLAGRLSQAKFKDILFEDLYTVGPHFFQPDASWPGYEKNMNLYYRFGMEWVNDDKYSNGGYVKAALQVEDQSRNDRIMAKYEVIFSDFSLVALLPPNTGNNYVSTSFENGSAETVAGTARNDTATKATLSQQMSSEASVSVASEVNHSKQHTFAEGASIGMEVESKFPFAHTKWSGEISFTATQVIENGWSKTDTDTKTTSTSHTATIEMPPYTAVMLRQSKTDTTVTTQYNCGVALRYKAKINISYYLNENNKYTSKPRTVSYTFGPDARGDLYQRAILDGGHDLDKEGIDWIKVLDCQEEVADYNGSLYKVNVVPLIATHAPMSSTGATMTETIKANSTSFEALAPLYPLKSIKLSAPNVKFISDGEYSGNQYNYRMANMVAGESGSTGDLELTGLNQYKVEYYGFSKYNGHWVLAGEDGTVLYDEQDPRFTEADLDRLPVRLTSSSAYGGQTYTAVREGRCYLKYLIDEDCYATADFPGTFATNASLASTAGLLVIVTEPKGQYSVTIDGSYEGTVGNEPEQIEKHLNVTFFDNEQDKEIDRYDGPGSDGYQWEQKEAKKRGITLTPDGMVKFTDSGTFHVRLTYKGYKSPWFEIKATGDETNDYLGEPEYTDPDENTAFLIGGSYQGIVDPERQDYIESDTRLTVIAVDETGKELDVEYAWEALEDDGIKFGGYDGGLVTFTKSGIYHVRVRGTASDGTSYVSGWTPITARYEDPPLRTVRYETNSAYHIDSDTVPDMDFLKRQADPERESGDPRLEYLFDGWYSDSDLTVPYDFSAPVTEDMTLYARWAERRLRFAITFDPTGGSVSPSEAETDAAGLLSGLPAPAREGYTFLGWFTAASGGEQVTEDRIYEADTVLYARWTKQSSDDGSSQSGEGGGSSSNGGSGNGGSGNGGSSSSGGSSSGGSGSSSSGGGSGNGGYSGNGNSATPVTEPEPAPEPERPPYEDFSDLQPGAWYRDGVEYALKHGIMTGMGDGRFAPDMPASRAMIVTMLWRVEGEPVSDFGIPFADVPEGRWYTDAIRWASAEGIVNGNTENDFGPDDSVTREQLAAILYRCAQRKGLGFAGAWTVRDFPDADQISEWAEESVQWMVMHRIIIGADDGTLDPKGNATRAQIAAMFMRYAETIAS